MSLSMEKVGGSGLTYNDYLLLPDDGQRHEIIGGEHYITPAPTVVHQRFLGKLNQILHQHVNRYQLGEVLFAPVDVLLSPRDIVQPDLLFVSTSGQARVTEKNILGAPDLVVEVISESSRKLDKKIKRKLYDEYGVVEYWLADPELRIVEIFRRDAENRLVKIEEHEDTGILTSPLFAGLEINMSDLW